MASDAAPVVFLLESEGQQKLVVRHWWLSFCLGFIAILLVGTAERINSFACVDFTGAEERTCEGTWPLAPESQKWERVQLPRACWLSCNPTRKYMVIWSLLLAEILHFITAFGSAESCLKVNTRISLNTPQRA
eukprot:TRINITY_DN48774_c0_g1_i1.p1 TRINITY_DN48774_c0_g1~~TRINITY_DN48774_c0_g1_i1.p1  ORF type:complete len:153 (+),score=3.13 TRINITY_DN48774_c0_g1_i1:62-460(+)